MSWIGNYIPTRTPVPIFVSPLATPSFETMAVTMRAYHGAGAAGMILLGVALGLLAWVVLKSRKKQ